MTTWINSQFPRPDFHRRVQRHYGLQDNGFPLKQSLTTDDIAGIQSVWGASQPDQFNSNGQNNDSSNTPANTTSYISSNGQIAIPNLRITTASRAEWFSVTVPASTTGTMVVTDQSANLSMLSPSLWLYKPGPKPPIAIGSASSTAYGATVSYSLAGVQAGQTYLIPHWATWLETRPEASDWRSTSARRLSPRLLLPTPWCSSNPIKEASSRQRVCNFPRVLKSSLLVT